jgi:hypothetical protein
MPSPDFGLQPSRCCASFKPYPSNPLADGLDAGTEHRRHPLATGAARVAIAPAADSHGGSKLVTAAKVREVSALLELSVRFVFLVTLVPLIAWPGQKFVEQRQRRTPRIAENLPMVDSGDLHAWRAVLPHHHPSLFLRMSSPNPNCNTKTSFPFH